MNLRSIWKVLLKASLWTLVHLEHVGQWYCHKASELIDAQIVLNISYTAWAPGLSERVGKWYTANEYVHWVLIYL